MHIKDYAQWLKDWGGPNAKRNFCSRIGWHPSQLDRLLRGERTNITINTILKMREASGNKVETIDDFVIDPK